MENIAHAHTLCSLFELVGTKIVSRNFTHIVFGVQHYREIKYKYVFEIK